jgi:hypothetical protein
VDKREKKSFFFGLFTSLHINATHFSHTFILYDTCFIGSFDSYIYENEGRKVRKMYEKKGQKSSRFISLYEYYSCYLEIRHLLLQKTIRLLLYLYVYLLRYIFCSPLHSLWEIFIILILSLNLSFSKSQKCFESSLKCFFFLLLHFISLTVEKLNGILMFFLFSL